MKHPRSPDYMVIDTTAVPGAQADVYEGTYAECEDFIRNHPMRARYKIVPNTL